MNKNCFKVAIASVFNPNVFFFYNFKVAIFKVAIASVFNPNVFFIILK
ncbi:MAG: hypothetical protein FWH29_00775 [Methanobrevibacter sp.]|nr:hypothetical protein [Methanobrevibacter sp.]